MSMKSEISFLEKVEIKNSIFLHPRLNGSIRFAVFMTRNSIFFLKRKKRAFVIHKTKFGEKKQNDNKKKHNLNF
jgi:hypothetical protein